MSLINLFYPAIIALLIPKGLALRCYSCSTINLSPTAGCVTGTLTEFNVAACANGTNYCSTVTAYVTVLGVSTVTTVRQCSSYADNSGCKTLGTLKTCSSSCATDRCNTGTNGSIRIGGGNTFIFVSMLLAVVSRFL